MRWKVVSSQEVMGGILTTHNRVRSVAIINTLTGEPEIDVGVCNGAVFSLLSFDMRVVGDKSAYALCIGITGACTTVSISNKLRVRVLFLVDGAAVVEACTTFPDL